MTQPHEVITRIDQVTFSGTVLRDFTGKLVNMEFPVEKDQPKTKLQFSEVKVHHSIAPYPHPAAELVMNRLSRKGEVSDLGPWGALIVSSNSQGYPDVLELKGKTLRLVATNHKIDADESRGQSEGTFLTWEILSIDGVDNRPKEAVNEQAPADTVTPPLA